MPVVIVTGSQACIPRDVLESYDIVVLPYTLELDGRVYHDGIDISPEEFYRALPSLASPPRTSGIPPGVFLDTFDKISSRADGILVITIANAMSTVFNNAHLAMESFSKVPVRLLDSGTAAIAQGLVVLEAAKASREGATLDDCYEAAKRASRDVELYAYISTFEYLRQSGRVNGIKAFAANALSIKPVFKFKQGDPVLVGNRRSTEKARLYIADEAEAFYVERGPLQLAIFHADARDEADDLTSLILQRIETSAEVILTEFTPVMGVHTGPGVVGAAFTRG